MAVVDMEELLLLVAMATHLQEEDLAVEVVAVIEATVEVMIGERHEEVAAAEVADVEGVGAGARRAVQGAHLVAEGARVLALEAGALVEGMFVRLYSHECA